jgi:hypothetical protein
MDAAVFPGGTAPEHDAQRCGLVGIELLEVERCWEPRNRDLRVLHARILREPPRGPPCLANDHCHSAIDKLNAARPRVDPRPSMLKGD